MDYAECEVQDPNRAKMFFVSVGIVMAAGLTLAGLALYCLQPPPPPPAPIFRPPPPEVRIEKQIVYVPTPPVEDPKPRIEPLPPPPPEVIGPLEGVWRTRSNVLPMLQLKHSGSTVSGTYSPATWAGVFCFKGGHVTADVAEFAVADGFLRMHFRLTLQSNGEDAKVETWLTPDDAVAMLAHANDLAKRAPQEALRLRLFIENELRRLGKKTTLGTFRRVPNPGDSL